MLGEPRTVNVRLVAAAAGAAAVAFVAALAALLPGVAFWDTAELQTVGPLLGTAHPTGYPTWVILGWLVSVVLQPFGEPAFRMNVFNAACLAVSAGLAVVLVRWLTGRTWLALATGIVLALTPIAWSIGTHADVHGLHLTLSVLLLVLLVDWDAQERAADGPRSGADRRIVAAAAVFGLALGNHNLVLLAVPGIALFVFAVAPRILRRRRLVVTCLAALLVSLVVVELELPLRAGLLPAPLVYGHPQTWDGFWSIVLAQQFQGSLIAPFSDLATKAATLVQLAWDQLGPLAGLVPFGFIATALSRPRYALLTGPTFAITCWFAASYDNADIGRYYLVPGLIALTWVAILVGVLVDALERTFLPGRLDRHGDRKGLPIVGFLAAAIVLAPTLAALPSRYALVDERGDHAAEDWLDRILDERLTGPNAVIVSWWSYSTPLWYAQHIEGRRPDIRVIDDRTRIDEHLGEIADVIDANLGRRPVIVIQVDPKVLAGLAERYQLSLLPIAGPQPVYRVDAFLADGPR